MKVFHFQYDSNTFRVLIRPDGDIQALAINQLEVALENTLLGCVNFSYAPYGALTLRFWVHETDNNVRYQLEGGSETLHSGVCELQDFDSVVTDERPGKVSGQGHWLALAGVGFKLLKTVKVVQVAFLAASVTAYSIIFSVEFALALIAILVFHEYGHLRAMKKFGLKTKGIYLIPFVGGMAVGEGHKSQWQEVYISMMGPIFGLAMSVLFYIIYLVSGWHFAGLVASISALLNLFNLIPVHPLDGGRVVKALVFSGRNQMGLMLLLALSALCFVAAWMSGLVFLVFFIVLGLFDIISAWQVPLDRDVVPLSRYGIMFSLLWYLLTALAFIALIVLIANTGLPGSEIAMKVLSS